MQPCDKITNINVIIFRTYRNIYSVEGGTKLSRTFDYAPLQSRKCIRQIEQSIHCTRLPITFRPFNKPFVLPATRIFIVLGQNRHQHESLLWSNAIKFSLYIDRRNTGNMYVWELLYATLVLLLDLLLRRMVSYY